jgi:pleiotropic regulator 1
LAAHPHEATFASAGADNIKKFKLPAGEFLHNALSQQRAIVNTLAINDDGVMASGGDDGSLWFWDYNSGHCYQRVDPIVQPGSLESEAGVYAAAFDVTGSRLITCNADKTIGCFRPVEDAAEATHPGLPFVPPASIRRF